MSAVRDDAHVHEHAHAHDHEDGHHADHAHSAPPEADRAALRGAAVDAVAPVMAPYRPPVVTLVARTA